VPRERIWGRDVEMYGLAQLGRLKQPRSPACLMNDELELLNSSLFSGSELSSLAKLQTRLTSPARSVLCNRLVKTEHCSQWGHCGIEHDRSSQDFRVVQVEPVTWGLHFVNGLYHLKHGLAIWLPVLSEGIETEVRSAYHIWYWRVSSTHIHVTRLAQSVFERASLAALPVELCYVKLFTRT